MLCFLHRSPFLLSLPVALSLLCLCSSRTAQSFVSLFRSSNLPRLSTLSVSFPCSARHSSIQNPLSFLPFSHHSVPLYSGCFSAVTPLCFSFAVYSLPKLSILLLCSLLLSQIFCRLFSIFPPCRLPFLYLFI